MFYGEKNKETKCSVLRTPSLGLNNCCEPVGHVGEERADVIIGQLMPHLVDSRTELMFCKKAPPKTTKKVTPSTPFTLKETKTPFS